MCMQPVSNATLLWITAAALGCAAAVANIRFGGARWGSVSGSLSGEGGDSSPSALLATCKLQVTKLKVASYKLQVRVHATSYKPIRRSWPPRGSGRARPACSRRPRTAAAPRRRARSPPSRKRRARRSAGSSSTRRSARRSTSTRRSSSLIRWAACVQDFARGRGGEVLSWALEVWCPGVYSICGRKWTDMRQFKISQSLISHVLYRVSYRLNCGCVRALGFRSARRRPWRRRRPGERRRALGR